jgi:hypothetical protein
VNLFDAPDADDAPTGEATVACTPAELLEFVRRCRRLTGRSPSLAEIKVEYGGILAATVCFWKLKDSGEWDRMLNERKNS